MTRLINYLTILDNFEVNSRFEGKDKCLPFHTHPNIVLLVDISDCLRDIKKPKKLSLNGSIIWSRDA